MSKLILSKHESIRLFLETRYIHDIYTNPLSSSVLENYLNEEELDEE
jgi:hypothetical protein